MQRVNTQLRKLLPDPNGIKFKQLELLTKLLEE
jgi:hypothetical protein